MLRESGLAAEAVVGFILDLDALCVVVQSAIEGLTAVASVAKKAMARLKEQHLAVYLEKLLETDFFKAAMTVVTNLVQVSAKDEVARSKLQRAVEILADSIAQDGGSIDGGRHGRNQDRECRYGDGFELHRVPHREPLPGGRGDKDLDCCGHGGLCP